MQLTDPSGDGEDGVGTRGWAGTSYSLPTRTAVKGRDPPPTGRVLVAKGHPFPTNLKVRPNSPLQLHRPAERGPALQDTPPRCLVPADCPWLAHPEVGTRGKEQVPGRRRKDFQGRSHLEPRQASPALSAADSSCRQLQLTQSR